MLEKFDFVLRNGNSSVGLPLAGLRSWASYVSTYTQGKHRLTGYELCTVCVILVVEELKVAFYYFLGFHFDFATQHGPCCGCDVIVSPEE